MKTALLLSTLSLFLSSTAYSKGIIGTVDKYLVVKTGQVIEVGSTEIDDGIATYYDYSVSKRKKIEVSELSKSTRKEIAGVKAGESILARTYLGNSRTETIIRICEVFYLFENQQAYVGCKSTEADRVPGYQLPNRFDFIINNVENVTAEAASLEGFEKGENAELTIDTESIKAGRTVRILVIYTNGEALVQKAGFNILDSSGILNKLGAVEKIQLSSLSKLNQ
ncbi:MAG: hypothetical protein WC635_01245 [Bacteriovorax sp.]|jgi:hypothetical protein